MAFSEKRKEVFKEGFHGKVTPSMGGNSEIEIPKPSGVRRKVTINIRRGGPKTKPGEGTGGGLRFKSIGGSNIIRISSKNRIEGEGQYGLVRDHWGKTVRRDYPWTRGSFTVVPPEARSLRDRTHRWRGLAGLGTWENSDLWSSGKEYLELRGVNWVFR